METQAEEAVGLNTSNIVICFCPLYCWSIYLNHPYTPKNTSVYTPKHPDAPTKHHKTSTEHSPTSPQNTSVHAHRTCPYTPTVHVRTRLQNTSVHAHRTCPYTPTEHIRARPQSTSVHAQRKQPILNSSSHALERILFSVL